VDNGIDFIASMDAGSFGVLFFLLQAWTLAHCFDATMDACSFG
jgi:hypothetical protein